MFRLITALVFTFFTGTLFCQSPQFVPGEILVMLQKNSGFEAFQAEYQSVRNGSEIKNYRQLSKTMNVYLISSDDFKNNEKQQASLLKQFSTVAMAQVNHYVSQRDLIPNDPRFFEQWQWKNTGLDDGIPRSDVSAQLAWETTTGGLTAAGDTIVVCVVDDGTDLEHEDLAANIWFNKNEIAGDSLDNDGNGFIDDVNGWNFRNEDNNVNDGGHGVNVAGMIGAVGNNNIGVSGINWNVKMMNVVYAGVSEDAVITAYDYPLQSRLLYNTTNGAEGAFVVSVNSSWGIDKGKPEEAPIWCNFYDIMGAAGIINVAATANAEINVDVDGDLPTGCTSPYLISVGRTNNEDEYARCGYGPVSIDLGAPGVDIFTTRSNDRYTTTTGTSFSSPLVAGMVALLYSYPCEEVGELMHEDFPAFALLVKDAILQGVDVKADYADKCLSSGRANMAKSLEILGLRCAACQVGTVLNMSHLSENLYELTFDDSALKTNLRYRIQDSLTWTVVNDVKSPFIVELPSACTVYSFQLQNICEIGDTSAWGVTVFFQSERCCVFPQIEINTSEDGKLTIKNIDLNQDQNSIVYYKPEISNVYTSVDVFADTVVINNILPCTFYNVFVLAPCIDGTTLSSDTFRIFSSCLSTCETNVCIPTGTADFGYIDDLEINGAKSISGNNQGYINYGDFLNINVPDHGVFSNTINVQKNDGENGRIRIFVDINKDGAFGTGENIFTQLIGVNNTSVNFDLNLNGTIPPGTYKMRAMLTFIASPQPCFGDQGEVEDYCINVFHVLVNECAPVDSIYQTNKTFTTIDLKWEDPQDDVLAFTYRFRELPDGEYTVTSDTAHKITLPNLKECTDYEFGIITVCNTDTSFFKTINFKTDCVMASSKLDDQITWKVFPNPFADRINVILTSRIYSDTKLRLTDAKGNVVSDQTLKLNPGDHYINLETNSNLPPGMYILTLADKTGIKSAKLIKQ